MSELNGFYGFGLGFPYYVPASYNVNAFDTDTSQVQALSKATKALQDRIDDPDHGLYVVPWENGNINIYLGHNNEIKDIPFENTGVSERNGVFTISGVGENDFGEHEIETTKGIYKINIVDTRVNGFVNAYTDVPHAISLLSDPIYDLNAVTATLKVPEQYGISIEQSNVETTDGYNSEVTIVSDDTVQFSANLTHEQWSTPDNYFTVYLHMSTDYLHGYNTEIKVYFNWTENVIDSINAKLFGSKHDYTGVELEQVKQGYGIMLDNAHDDKVNITQNAGTLENAFVTKPDGTEVQGLSVADGVLTFQPKESGYIYTIHLSNGQLLIVGV